MNVGDIIEGTAKEIVGFTNDEIKKRLQICIDCPMNKKTLMGNICNPDLWIDPENNVLSLFEKEGFYKGCGCRLSAKVRCEGCHCPAKKW